MQPITNIDTFLQRFNNFKDAEFRSIDIGSATTMSVVFATQDEARSFDWITVTLEFNEISDAKLLDDSKLSLVDMQDGISLITDNKRVGFALGRYNTITSIKDSVCYIKSNSIKYSEGSF